MTTITTTDVRVYIDRRLTAGASQGEVNRELAILKRAFNLAVQAGKLFAKPYIPMLRENNVRSGFFEPEQFEQTRDHLPEALRGIVTFGYLTGWRITSEILPLEWRQVDRQTATIRLDPGTTKNDRARVFPYGDIPDLQRVIEAQWQRHQALARRGTICPWVFHRRGKRIVDFRGAWESAVTAAGCPDRIPHDLRRTAVRNLVRAGVSEKTAMLLTGHRTRSVFDRYDIVNEGDLRSAVRKLGQASIDQAGAETR